jgi:hypothetical protein
MKILCLHGYGTNTEVLEYQLSGLRKHADLSWDFHYLPGEVSCLPAPGKLTLVDISCVHQLRMLTHTSLRFEGIESVFSGPYFCFTHRFDPESVGASYALLEKAIFENGPFDGVLGFSQGAATIVGYLIEQATAYPDEPLPFQFMILCSPTIPLSDNLDYCQKIFGSIDPKDEAHIRSCEDEQYAQLSEPARTALSTFTNVIDSTASITHEPRSFYLDQPLSEIPCILHPELCTSRLDIPTLHIRGKNDLPALKDTGSLVQSFCNSGKQRVLEHTAGHDIPRGGPELRQMVSAMEWVVAQSELPTY